MKKIITVVTSIIFIISTSINVFAMKSVPTFFQLYSSNERKNIEFPELVIDGVKHKVHIFEIAGEAYRYRSGSLIKYDEEAECKFAYDDYIITDNGYYTTYTVYVDHPVRGISTLKLYDKEFNLIKERLIDYAYDIGYVDGLYYVYYNGHVEVSSDFENWNRIEGDMPKHNFENTITIKDDTVRFNPKENFTEVSYEDGISTKYESMLGNWFIKYDEEDNMYLTKDNVYLVKIEYDKNEHKGLGSDTHFTIDFCYDDGDSIIIEDDKKGNRIIISKNELYNAMSEYENAPYVQLNDKILGFSQPPVMEDDRTLVPMRFLFEQMGAEVDWNNDTQTATATMSADTSASTFGLKNERSVTFSIDNTTATVNGESETMDVPARLINDQTFVPLRFLSENLGYNVEWDNDTRTAIITTE